MPFKKLWAPIKRKPENIIWFETRFYQNKRDLFLSGLSSSRFKIHPCQAPTFKLAVLAALALEPDEVFAERLVKRISNSSIPFQAFNSREFDKHLLRFCFAKTNENLGKGHRNSCKL